MGKIYVNLRYLRHYYSCVISHATVMSFLSMSKIQRCPHVTPKKSEPQHLCLRFDEGCFEHLYCQWYQWYIGICHCQALLRVSFCSLKSMEFSASGIEEQTSRGQESKSGSPKMRSGKKPAGKKNHEAECYTSSAAVYIKYHQIAFQKSRNGSVSEYLN